MIEPHFTADADAHSFIHRACTSALRAMARGDASCDAQASATTVATAVGS